MRHKKRNYRVYLKSGRSFVVRSTSLEAAVRRAVFTFGEDANEIDRVTPTKDHHYGPNPRRKRRKKSSKRYGKTSSRRRYGKRRK